MNQVRLSLALLALTKWKENLQLEDHLLPHTITNEINEITVNDDESVTYHKSSKRRSSFMNQKLI